MSIATGQPLEFWVKERGWTIKAFAGAIGVSRQAVHVWLKGGTIEESRKLLICRVLGVEREAVLW